MSLQGAERGACRRHNHNLTSTTDAVIELHDFSTSTGQPPAVANRLPLAPTISEIGNWGCSGGRHQPQQSQRSITSRNALPTENLMGTHQTTGWTRSLHWGSALPPLHASL